jgi:hypothetical protein
VPPGRTGKSMLASRRRQPAACARDQAASDLRRERVFFAVARGFAARPAARFGAFALAAGLAPAPLRPARARARQRHLDRPRSE